MIYDLSRDRDRELFISRCRKLLNKQSSADLTEHAFKSPAQNRYIHLLIGVVAMTYGVDMEYAKREYFKKLVNPAIFVRHFTDPLTGEDAERILSLRIVPKEKVAEAIDRFIKWGTEQDIIMPLVGDELTLRQIEIAMSQCRYL